MIGLGRAASRPLPYGPPLVAAALLVCTASAHAQRVAGAVAPDTALVGDIFRAALRADLPAGWRAVFPDTLPLAGEVEHAGRVELRTEALPDGGERVTAIFRLSAWRPGEVKLPDVSVTLIDPEGVSRAVDAAFPPVRIRSVLPADTAGLEPRSLKDVLGPSRTWAPYILLLLGVLLVLAAIAYLRRSRRPRAIPAFAGPTPREKLVATLDRARELGLVEAGQYKAFYSMVSQAVRRFLETLDHAWGAELTTTELLERVVPASRPEEAEALSRVLRSADLVKFARRRPAPADALGDWEVARWWALEFGRPAEIEPEEVTVPATQEVA